MVSPATGSAHPGSERSRTISIFAAKTPYTNVPATEWTATRASGVSKPRVEEDRKREQECEPPRPAVHRRDPRPLHAEKAQPSPHASSCRELHHGEGDRCRREPRLRGNRRREGRGDDVRIEVVDVGERHRRSVRRQTPDRQRSEPRLDWLAHALVAQGIERWPPEPEVVGSIPTGRIRVCGTSRRTACPSSALNDRPIRQVAPSLDIAPCGWEHRSSQGGVMSGELRFVSLGQVEAAVRAAVDSVCARPCSWTQPKGAPNA